MFAVRFAIIAFVLVLLVEELLVVSKLAMIAEVVTFKLLVKKGPVEVPPANWRRLVVLLP